MNGSINENGSLVEDEVENIQHSELRKFIEYKMEEEVEREKSLLEQSSRMQQAFSFVVAAYYVALSICIQTIKIEKAPLFYYRVSALFSICMIISLLFCTIPQWRNLRVSIGDIDQIRDSIFNDENKKYNIKSYYTDIRWIDLLTKEIESIEKINNKRVKWIIASMVFFFLSLFILLISLLYGGIMYFS